MITPQIVMLSLYVDNPNTDGFVNARANAIAGLPIPTNFANYNGTTMLSDQTRDGLGYPMGWTSYHCELLDATHPAVMDNYFLDPAPVLCRHDRITRQFLIDRITAKLSR